MAVIVASLITISSSAFAQSPTPAPAPNTGDSQGGLINLNLLNNLEVCPDITALLGSVLSVLGLGAAEQHAGGDTVVCVINRHAQQG